MEAVECYEKVVVKRVLTQWNRNWYEYLIHRAVSDMHRYFERAEKPYNKYYLKLITFKDKYLQPLYETKIKPFYQNNLKPLLSKVKNKLTPYYDKIKDFLKCYFWLVHYKYNTVKLWLKKSYLKLFYKLKDYKLSRDVKKYTSKGKVIRRRHPIHLALLS